MSTKKGQSASGGSGDDDAKNDDTGTANENQNQTANENQTANQNQNQTANTIHTPTLTPTPTPTPTSTKKATKRVRREKRDKIGEYTIIISGLPKEPKKKKKKKTSKALKKHGKDNPSGGLESLLPSLIGVAVLVIAVMAQRGFRGRASVAGIDLGTTNSVICVQRPSKGVGVIDCVEDPLTNSPIVPSVVSVYDPQRDVAEIRVGPSSKTKTLLDPHPTRVVVGHAAKRRIDTHPHHTLYNAKRVLGRPYNDVAVDELRREVEFRIEEEPQVDMNNNNNKDDKDDKDDNTSTATSTATKTAKSTATKTATSTSTLPLESVFRVDEDTTLTPQQVGGHVVNFLMGLARDFLGHDNVRSAVLAVPAKFDAHQRKRTFEAFKLAGVTVARVLEEPTAAALAYGLHKKEGVEKILVYDFGGGTLDISILHVSEGYCDVMGSDGDDRLGGADFDVAIAHLLAQQHSSVLENLAAYGKHGSHNSNNNSSNNSNNSNNNNNSNGEDHNVDDMAEVLASACHRITDDLPLCSVSSFHTLGEKVKISLSEQQYEQQESNGTVDAESITARAKCLALPPVSQSQEFGSVPPKALCESLYVETLEVTLGEFNSACQPLFDRSVVPATRLVEDLTLQKEEIDEIVMVGGTTRMPQIRELVRQAFPNAQVNTHIDPDVTVAYGAASVID
eukprot:CAMPEP_0172389654 /NCGR_PEP_ID=MMETSP1061-20121228/6484_1 /TAXON_ID=37318 /ORGANISM="Pseudo-nitzschia pungens, Strain cf. pungens" /LENGTH=676 /DNA_ID=CAMNT_0013119843 /DNA_START=303 /DNA_END=2333 /DNA_ORIENTATION=+